MKVHSNEGVLCAFDRQCVIYPIYHPLYFVIVADNVLNVLQQRLFVLCWYSVALDLYMILLMQFDTSSTLLPHPDRRARVDTPDIACWCNEL